jgi:hypothetical protein
MSEQTAETSRGPTVNEPAFSRQERSRFAPDTRPGLRRRMRRIFCAHHWASLVRIQLPPCPASLLGVGHGARPSAEGSEGVLLLAEVRKREGGKQADNNKHAGQLLFAFDSFRHHGVHHHREKSAGSYGTHGGNDLRGSTA